MKEINEKNPIDSFLMMRILYNEGYREFKINQKINKEYLIKMLSDQKCS